MLDFNDAGPQGGGKRDNLTELPLVRKARVERQAKARIREFARYLFPRAKLSGADARIGDIDGHPGQSLSISLASDESAGRWKDHATNEKGDLFTLWGRLHGLDDHRDLMKIVEEIDQWLGGAPTARAEARHKEEAAKPAEPEPTKTLERTHVYKDKTGRKVAEVRRYTLSNGKKTFLPFLANGVAGMPSPRTLYNLEHWHTSEAVVLVEGEKCADALHGIGVDATSLMGGANTVIEKTDLTPLAGKLVVLWPDNDEPGFGLMDKLDGPLRALGCKVRHVKVPDGKPEGWDAADAVQEGFDVIGYLRERSAPSGSSIRHKLWPDIAYQYEPELVEGLFPRIGVATLYGPSGGGKSFASLDWMSAIATGSSLFGRDTAAVGVLYLAFEGFHGITKRIQGIKQEHGPKAVALELVEAPWILTEPQDWQAMRAHIAAAKERLDETGYPLGIIVIDTLTAAYAGIDANSQGEVTRAMRQLKQLSMEEQCLVIPIGHTGKNTTLGMAGSFAYKSESDTFIEFQVEKDDACNVVRRSVRVEKVKDGASDYILSDFRLQEVSIGTKPNGKPITTCVVEWLPHASSAPSPAAAEQAEQEARERSELLRRQILDGMVASLGEGWMPARETANRLKSKGVRIARDKLVEILQTFASEREEDHTKIAHADATIEVRTKRTDARTTLHFRMMRDA